MKPNSKILIIAGSDSSGGAGIQADIKTVTALGSYAMTAITAVTIQNTIGVKSIVGINPKEIFNQIVFTCKDIKPDAIKIGMLHSSNVIKMVIKALNLIKVKNIILDPVMIAKGGAKLIDNNAIKLLKSEAAPLKPWIPIRTALGLALFFGNHLEKGKLALSKLCQFAFAGSLDKTRFDKYDQTKNIKKTLLKFEIIVSFQLILFKYH